ncbi:sirohydrochlorin chelatase [Alkalicoccus saliphilus]|uniref:Sirohydrochlorin chelatase n=1 Tax=Alkalicoccus saliphilus TaxID=200989 RepID=A0A2T4U2E8_9BACI|nr:sirohydrochlorin chelatase [Alkalicoccus saliphilus]PTL37579.1 hypothetical protein C6Y45_15690 [Alkalicoccus saliphilus]
MKHILLIGHGSRDSEGTAQFKEMVETVRKKAPHYPVHYCFLELAAPDIAEGVKECAEAGASDVIAIPVLLSKAGHYKRDIPVHLEEAGKLYPGTAVHYGEYLGGHPLTADVLMSRLLCVPETQKRQSEIVLVSQGSSDKEGNSSIKNLAVKLGQKLQRDPVHTAFMVAASPSLEMKLEELVQQGKRKIVILPGFLFEGAMVKKIRKTAAAVNEKQGRNIIFQAECFGTEDLFAEIIADRITAAAHEIENAAAEKVV